MKKQLIQFSGLYGDTQKVVFPNFIHHELIETRSKMYNWEINEHLHTELFQLFMINSGNGYVKSGKSEFTINGPSIILIPANTIHGFVFQPNVSGEVITFSETFLEAIFKNHSKIFLQFGQLNLIDFNENQSNFELISRYKNQILEELIEERNEKKLVIQLLFQLFFLEIYRCSYKKTQEADKSDNRTVMYFKEFQKLIKQSITETKPISEYAKVLHITPVHLNRICQTMVQQSALQVVHGYLLAEAKKYLLNTSYTIAEISYLLNFKDPAYFTRLFKKQTGVSPSEFKKN